MRVNRSAALIGMFVSLVSAARAAEPRPDKVLARPGVGVTSLELDAPYLYWSQNSHDEGAPVGVRRVDLRDGKTQALWTQEPVERVVVGSSTLFFISDMSQRLSALAKDGGPARTLFDQDKLDVIAKVDMSTLADVVVSGDHLLLAVVPTNPCTDSAGAIVQTGLDGSKPKIIARGCPGRLALDGTHIYWREWGAQPEDGTTTPDRVMRVPRAGGQVELLATEPVFGEVIVLGGGLFFVIEDRERSGREDVGLVRLDTSTKERKLLVKKAKPEILSDGLDLYLRPPWTGRVSRLDEAKGKIDKVLNVSPVVPALAIARGDLYFVETDQETRACVIKASGANAGPATVVDDADLEIDLDLDLSPLDLDAPPKTN